MIFLSRIEGYHSSYLEGLRQGDLARSRRAVTAVGEILRQPLIRMCSWWGPQLDRWSRLHFALAEKEREAAIEAEPQAQGELL